MCLLNLNLGSLLGVPHVPNLIIVCSSSALLAVINCHWCCSHVPSRHSDRPIVSGRWCSCGLGGIVVALRGVKHAHPCVSNTGGGFMGNFITQTLTKQGCSGYLGGACSHKWLRTHQFWKEIKGILLELKGKPEWLTCSSFITNTCSYDLFFLNLLLKTLMQRRFNHLTSSLKETTKTLTVYFLILYVFDCGNYFSGSVSLHQL